MEFILFCWQFIVHCYCHICSAYIRILLIIYSVPGMMYGFGDSASPLHDTVELVEVSKRYCFEPMDNVFRVEVLCSRAQLCIRINSENGTLEATS